MAKITLDQLLDEEVTLSTGMNVKAHALGEIDLPSGRLVARDPLSGSSAPPFSIDIAPGHYPVSVRMLVAPSATGRTAFHDIAALVIRFRAERCARWELAVTDDDPDPSELRAGAAPGFMVDSATAALLDETYQDALEGDDVRDRLWAAKELPPGGALVSVFGGDNPARLVLCSSGIGDGVYPAWVGVDASDEPVALIVDFKMVELQRPALLTDAQLDTRVEIVACELAGRDEAVRGNAVSEARALGERARSLVPAIERALVTTTSSFRRDLILFAFADLVRELGLRDEYMSIVEHGEPVARLEAALAVVAQIEGESASVAVGEMFLRVANSAQEIGIVVAAVEALGVIAIEQFTAWVSLAQHQEPRVRAATFDAIARWFGVRRSDSPIFQQVAVAGMRDPVAVVRERATRTLAAAVADDPTRRHALVAALEHDDPAVVVSAAGSLVFRADLDGPLRTTLRVALERVKERSDSHREAARGHLNRLDRAAT